MNSRFSSRNKLPRKMKTDLAENGPNRRRLQSFLPSRLKISAVPPNLQSHKLSQLLQFHFIIFSFPILLEMTKQEWYVGTPHFATATDFSCQIYKFQPFDQLNLFRYYSD